MHITYIPSNDERRHKSWCIYYDDNKCLLKGGCSGSVHCLEYSDNAEGLDGVVRDRWLKRVTEQSAEELSGRIISETPYDEVVTLIDRINPEVNPDEVIKASSLLDVFINGSRCLIPSPTNRLQRDYYTALSSKKFSPAEEQLWDVFKHFNFTKGFQTSAYKFLEVLSKAVSERDIILKGCSILTLEKLCFRYAREVKSELTPCLSKNQDGVFIFEVR